MSEPIDDKPDEAVEQRSRELFDAQVANLDARTRSRLNQARQAALEVARGAPRHTLGSRWLLPVGSAAALALVALSTFQFIRPGNETVEIAMPAVASTVDDVEILTSSEEWEMLQDVDFYAWLETQEGMGNAGVSEAG